ncbi:hypothetical protein TNCV_533551 [Trichonephila clavipes]|nr:hypothetical protein TNCV_533551 [Trichonephila clavipes]
MEEENKLLDHVISRLELNFWIMWRNSETQPIVRIINSQTGISRRIGGIPELTTDTLIIADCRGNPTVLEVKVLVIIGGSLDDAEVVNLIIDSIIKVVNRVVRGTVLSRVKMVKTDFDKKSLVIPDDQIKALPIVEKPVEIDISDTKLGERQKQKLQDL